MMSPAPSIFLATDHLNAEVLVPWLEHRFHGSVESKPTVHQIVAAFRAKSRQEQQQIKAVVIHDRLPIYYPGEDQEAFSILGEAAIRDLKDQDARGLNTIRLLTEQFKLSAGMFIYSDYPAYLEGLPLKLDGIIKYESGNYVIEQPQI